MFGDDLESAVVYGVDCAGNETGFLNCTLSLSGTCSEHSAAVICQGMTAAVLMLIGNVFGCRCIHQIFKVQ